MGHGIHMDAPVPAVDPLEAQRYEEDYDHSQISLHVQERLQAPVAASDAREADSGGGGLR